MTTAWFSLRRRLLGLLLGGVAAAWLTTMVFSYIDAHHEVDELFDAQLAQAAQTLLALAGHDEGDDIEDLGDVAHKYQRRLRFQIWRADGKLLMRSNNAPESPLTEARGFSETLGEDGHWRHFSQWNDEHSLQVQVSENHHIRDDLIGHIAWRLIFPALFGLPLIGLWVWLATRHALRPGPRGRLLLAGALLGLGGAIYQANIIAVAGACALVGLAGPARGPRARWIDTALVGLAAGATAAALYLSAFMTLGGARTLGEAFVLSVETESARMHDYIQTGRT